VRRLPRPFRRDPRRTHVSLRIIAESIRSMRLLIRRRSSPSPLLVRDAVAPRRLTGAPVILSWV
jgi:hypothetical protein